MAQAVNIKDLRAKAKIPAREAGGGTVKAFFQANRDAMAAVLPKHVSPDRMLRIALTAVRAVPQLMECTTESLMGSVMQCAQLGLEPNTPLGHAYMIPFRNRRAGRTDVQVVIGYKGLIDLARRSGQIVSLAAHAVYERDEFDFAYGLDERLEHRPARGDRGEIIAFYAVAKLKDGGYQFEVLWREQVDAIMRATQSKGEYGPWRDHYEEMGRKTAIRRLAKYLPLSIEFATATAMDAMAATGQEQHLDQVLTGKWSVVQEPEAVEREAMDQQAVGEEGTDDWPRQDEQGQWVDVNGEIYDTERHGWNRDEDRPSVNSDGIFRARRRRRRNDSAQARPTDMQHAPDQEAPAPADEDDLNLE